MTKVTDTFVEGQKSLHQKLAHMTDVDLESYTPPEQTEPRPVQLRRPGGVHANLRRTQCS